MTCWDPLCCPLDCSTAHHQHRWLSLSLSIIIIIPRGKRNHFIQLLSFTVSRCSSICHHSRCSSTLSFSSPSLSFWVFLSTSLSLKTPLMRSCLSQWQSLPPENPILCRPSGSSPPDRFQMVVQCCQHRDFCNVENVPTLASHLGEYSPSPEDEKKKEPKTKNSPRHFANFSPVSNLLLLSPPAPDVACACQKLHEVCETITPP